MNHATLKQTVIPSWMIKALVVALIGVMVTGVAAMASRLSTSSGNHEARISVLEDHQKGIDNKLNNIDAKIDILISRREHGSRPTQ